MKLSIVDRIGMPFGQIQVFNIHIAFDREKVSCSIFVKKSNLFISIDYHQMGPSSVET